MADGRLLIMHNLFGISTYPLSKASGPCPQRSSGLVSSIAAAMPNELKNPTIYFKVLSPQFSTSMKISQIRANSNESLTSAQ